VCPRTEHWLDSLENPPLDRLTTFPTGPRVFLLGDGIDDAINWLFDREESADMNRLRTLVDGLFEPAVANSAELALSIVNAIHQPLDIAHWRSIIGRKFGIGDVRVSDTARFREMAALASSIFTRQSMRPKSFAAIFGRDGEHVAVVGLRFVVWYPRRHTTTSMRLPQTHWTFCSDVDADTTAHPEISMIPTVIWDDVASLPAPVAAQLADLQRRVASRRFPFIDGYWMPAARGCEVILPSSGRSAEFDGSDILRRLREDEER
jgi:hypothetical protein